MPEIVLWGHKTVAFLDVWSIEHFVAGVGLFGLARWIALRAHNGLPMPQFKHYIAYLLMIAYGWEAVEFYLETGASGVDAVTHWFQGVEHWSNRLISDPFLVLMGGYIGYKAPKWTWFGRAFSIGWLFIHIYMFPHSMYLHEYL